MLSEPASVVVRGKTNSTLNSSRRDSLKLSFARSISQPHPEAGINSPILSPPTLSPSLHPSKRCRMELASQSSMRPDVISLSPCTTSNVAPFAAHKPTTCLLRPPPTSISGSVSLPSSPCSESSTLQRTLLLQKARTIEPLTLAGKLETKPTTFPIVRNASAPNSSTAGILLIDCRPFIAYNVNHIKGAINVNCCDRFNRKRLQQGKATLADLATTKEGKELLKKRTWKEVVVYDDCSESLEHLPVSHTLFLVMNALVEDHREPIMLLGGLRDFQVGHRSLCEDYLMNSGASSSNGLCRTPTSHLLPDLPSPSDICNTKDIENHPASQVLPYLFLGNMRDASDGSSLKDLGIKYVLNVTAKPPNYPLASDLVYKQICASDSGIQNLRQFFEEAFDFIDLARSNASGVLIHCHAGVSRSPTIAVAYLMKHYPMAMSEAYKFVKTRRSIISPNLNFMGQLWEYEQGLSEPTAEEASSHKCQKEPLTVEMKAVKESIRSQKSFFLGSSSSAYDLSTVNEKGFNGIRWTDRPKEEEEQGCSV
ncbi:hypothetical protein TCAL_09404 [Tigriopus californicus]|uniref:protein-tyrosine-phosphatase n=1 Tax=Tigriopus californicus TaxID=6832 RepID=A0A553NVQ4_TIGCA|nr:hypothetical protein TCAL_09404 [Tigriopus californicus]|eukprot:TCALIF_09404-PA protein Name:"Similar to DUSP10 Dual specificity protein phosphatase 10 (Bos taurus)" AED:0.04 eAED:0.14 QI:0/-1/0/1/-1/1/1/0/537